jgi:serine/threonine-protein kinase
MELVEGETLEERIARGPLPWREAVDLFEAVADGLKVAHESGIVHRDLKPANIKIDREGRPKILDFGLARASPGEGAVAMAGLTHSPTLTAAATLPGVLLGTAAYMSPEQARGRPVDRRADVWAFGCCLYEALTARRAFEGEDVSLTLAAVLTREPDWQHLPAGLPLELSTLLRRCLEKDARQRVQDIGDARWWLSQARRVEQEPTVAAGTAATSRGHALAAVLALVALVSTTAAVWLAVARLDHRRDVDAAAPAPSARFRVAPGVARVSSQIAVHPSGTRFVFSAANGLNVYDLAEGVTHPIPGETGDHPFFSSDGAWVGITQYMQVLKVPASGGLGQHLTFLGGEPAGMSWQGDRILFGTESGPSRGLWILIPSTGSKLERLGEDPALANGVHPSFVEGRDLVLFTGRNADGVLRPSVFDRASATVHDLGVEGSSPQYLSSGHLLWERARRVWAARFDLERLRLVGEPVPLIELGSTALTDFGSTRAAVPSFAVSANGTLVTPDLARLDLVEVGADGSRRRLAVPTGEVSDLRLSPDGRLLAYTRGELGSEQVWIHELATGRETALSEGRRVSAAVWTPDGALVFLDRSSSRFALRLAIPERGGEPLTLFESDQRLIPSTVSPGGVLLFTQGTLPTGVDRLDLARPQQAEVWSKEAYCSHLTFSPDGRWVAYDRFSGESGTRVYVRSYQGPGTERPVSVDRGWAPEWARDGRTLYFKQSSGLMAVAANPQGDTLDLGPPRPAGSSIPDQVSTPDLDYAPLPDGRGFIVVDEAEPRGFTVMTNVGRYLRERDRAASPARP